MQFQEMLSLLKLMTLPLKDGFFHQKGLIHRQDAFSGVVVSGFGADQQFWEIHFCSSNSFLIRWIVR